MQLELFKGCSENEEELGVQGGGKARLILGDCIEKMRELEDNSIDMILTDPPYFKVKNEAWDRQWDKPNEFLAWLDKCAEQWQRILKPNGSLYCFASPQMSARVEVMLMERFNVLTRITWDKEATYRFAL
jgi:site-specific DNA-methyltransferase (adenine-specific)